MPTKGQIHPVFLQRTQELATQARAKLDAIRGGGQRPWNRPQDWSGNPDDLVGLVAAYDRSPIDQNYSQLIAAGDDPGTTGDVVSVKTQSDYVALQERGLRTRYASVIRCLAHAAARWRGHGNARGIFTDGVIRYVQDAVKAGGS